MRGTVRILAVYANMVLAFICLANYVMGFRLDDGWRNLNPFSVVYLLLAVPPMLALATLRWPPTTGVIVPRPGAH